MSLSLVLVRMSWLVVVGKEDLSVVLIIDAT